jgi:chloramphenicol 3-O phosphotransferase
VSLGRVLVLNGTSSSGKSTLASALQTVLPDPWLVIGIDTFVFALPRRFLDQPGWSEVFRYVRPDGASDGPFRIETGPLGETLIAGMHRCVAALAESGLSVIVDHVVLERTWLDDLDARLAGIDWRLVAVRCPLDVVERRERDRRDRTLGQAAAQFGVVHAHGVHYDLEVDTSQLSPEEAASRIAATLDEPAGRGARPAATMGS